MSLQKIITEAETILKKSDIDHARLEAGLLLCHALKIDREKMVAGDISKLSAKEQRRFFALVKRRARREPLAYLTGHKEFYGLDFLVNQHTLIPRPETELLIESVLEKFPVVRCPLPVAIIDVGTGSGAIAITLAKHLPGVTVLATDISDNTLRVARKNAKKHQVKIIFKKGHLLKPFNKRLSNISRQIFITANLPYLPTSIWKKTQPEIKNFEPRNAVDGGPDGLKYYRQLLKQIKISTLHPTPHPLTLFLEIDPTQPKKLSHLIKKTFPATRVEIKKDLAGRDRLLVATIN